MAGILGFLESKVGYCSPEYHRFAVGCIFPMYYKMATHPGSLRLDWRQWIPQSHKYLKHFLDNTLTMLPVLSWMKANAAKQLQRWNREKPNVCGGLARRIPQNAEQLAPLLADAS